MPPRTLASALPFLMLVSAACADLFGPGVERQERPFYYYQDERIFLEADLRQLTLATRETGDTALVRSELERLGVGAEALEPLVVTQAEPHWLLRIAGTAPGAPSAEGVAALLRRSATVTFASAVYHGREGEGVILLVNRFAVVWQEGADASAAERLHTRMGVRRGAGCGGCFEYPLQSRHTPLEIAAAYHRHPLVAWASPDLIAPLRR